MNDATLATIASKACGRPIKVVWENLTESTGQTDGETIVLCPSLLNYRANEFDDTFWHEVGHCVHRHAANGTLRSTAEREAEEYAERMLRMNGVCIRHVIMGFLPDSELVIPPAPVKKPPAPVKTAPVRRAESPAEIRANLLNNVMAVRELLTKAQAQGNREAVEYFTTELRQNEAWLRGENPTPVMRYACFPGTLTAFPSRARR